MSVVMLVFYLAFLSGCSKKTDTPKKQQASGDILTEIKNEINNGDYEKLKGMFLGSSKDKFTQADFENLKSIMDNNGQSTYYFIPGKDNKMMAVKIYTVDGKDYIDTATVIPEVIGLYVKDAADPLALELSEEPTQVNISNKLTRSSYVYGAEWSPDNTCVAFIRGDVAGNREGQMYLWNVGEKKALAVNNIDLDLCSLSWFPDSEYIFADGGTDIVRMGHVVQRKEAKEVASFPYVYKAVWSPDSKMIAYGGLSNIPANSETQLENIVDLSVYDVEKNAKTVLKKGNADFYFVPEKWMDNKNLQYKMKYYNTLDEKLFDLTL
jgi:hypothetical protein